MSLDPVGVGVEAGVGALVGVGEGVISDDSGVSLESDNTSWVSKDSRVGSSDWLLLANIAPTKTRMVARTITTIFIKLHSTPSGKSYLQVE